MVVLPTRLLSQSTAPGCWWGLVEGDPLPFLKGEMEGVPNPAAQILE